MQSGKNCITRSDTPPGPLVLPAMGNATLPKTQHTSRSPPRGNHSREHGVHPKSYALQLAVEAGDFNVVEALLRCGADGDVLNSQHFENSDQSTTLLMVALESWARIEVALRGPPFRPFVHARKDHGLHDFAKIVRLLKERGAYKDPDRVNSRGRTALMIAAETGNSDMVEELMQVADPNIKDHKGDTALTLAARAGHPYVVERIVDDPRVDPNLAVEGRTALMLAAEGGSGDVVEKLMQSRCVDVDWRNKKDGRTALMLAAECGYDDVVEQLMQSRRVDWRWIEYHGY